MVHISRNRRKTGNCILFGGFRQTRG